MAIIDELIAQVADEQLRKKLEIEANKFAKQKKFGLVFEEHLPECTPLYDVSIKRGQTVALRDGEVNNVFLVESVKEGVALCRHQVDNSVVSIPVENLMTVAEFGNPIYPYLKPIDSLENAPDTSLWHTLIESDNYHALQLLEYLYAGKVDCIYIDPPYNTGAKDWKYNNDYVDSKDQYRHSKWLSFMERRLKIASKLLNPNESVLIVAIDEKEYLRLGLLLEQTFPEANIQMVSTVIKPEGTSRANEFSRTNEFIFFVMFGSIKIKMTNTTMFEVNNTSDAESEEEEAETETIEWRNLRRRESNSIRDKQHPNQFYPFFIDKNTGYISSIGEPLPFGVNRDTVKAPEGTYALFPLTPKGVEMMWGKKYDSVVPMFKKGYIKVDNGKTPGKAVVKYLSKGTVNAIDAGKIVITGHGEQNEIIGEYESDKLYLPKTMWYLPSHNSQAHGSILLKKLIGENDFPYPKSLYAVHDALRFFVADKPNAIIIDFFAGSGTTLHAVNLLNAEDGGSRRCICVTNNEVTAVEAKSLRDKGYHPGETEWERYGIARNITWPRIVNSIKGVNASGEPLKGNYISETDMPMSAGFKANVAFFKLGFLDKTAVSLGRQLKVL